MFAKYKRKLMGMENIFVLKGYFKQWRLKVKSLIILLKGTV